MRDLGPDLERRQHPRQRPDAVCQVILGTQRHDARILDASRGGLFVETDAPVRPAAIVRVLLPAELRSAPKTAPRCASADSRVCLLADRERFALVVHQRHVPPRLRGLLPGGVGLRWVRAASPH